jgi:uncharacterized protein YaiL (DUF2058 family)
MGDLRDAFKKAGLIDEKTDRRLKHEERLQKGELGREGLAQKQQQEEAERHRREEAKRADAKAAQQKHDAAQKQSERWKKLVRELEAQARRGTSGPRRFHYIDAEGFLPYLQVDDETGRRLEAGELAIVRLPDGDQVALAPRALAQELHAFEPERVLFVAGGG